MSKLIAFISSFMVVFLVIGMAAYFRYYAPAGTFLHPELDPASIVRDVRGLNALAVSRVGVQRVVKVDGTAFLIGGVAAAAVNLSAVNQYSVESVRAHEAVLRLPAPRVTGIAVDSKPPQIWNSREAAWGAGMTLDPERQRKVQAAAVDGIRESAIALGILEEARRNARQTVSAFLGARGITQVRFEEE